MPNDCFLQHFTRTFQYCDFVVKFRDVLRPTATRAEKTQFAQSNVHFQYQEYHQYAVLLDININTFKICELSKKPIYKTLNLISENVKK